MTADGRVGVGVIGAGNISSQYLDGLCTFADLDVRFIADIDEERARQQAEKYGVAGFGSVDSLLADDEIEIVVNLTVPAAHVEVALRVLAAGKNVWTEKPFALDRESGRRLLEAAEAAGLRVATAPDTFLGAGIQSACRLLNEGGIGRPLSALVLLQSPGAEAWHPNPDFLYQAGAGPLFDVGPYYLTALVQFFGPASRVSALSGRAHESRVIGSGPRAGESFAVTVDTQVAALIEFESGQTAQALFSVDSKLSRTQFEITGVDGTLVVPDPNGFGGDLLVWADDPEPRTVLSVGSTTTRGTGVVELARALRAGVPERASGEQAFHVLDIMVSVLESAQSGLPVKILSTMTAAPPLPEGWDARARTLLK